MLGLERDNLGSPTGGGAGNGLCIDPEDLDGGPSFGSGVKTSIIPTAQLYGAGYSLGYTASGTAGAVQTFQGGGVGFGFARAASDVFTEGEGVAGHPAKWGYRRLPVCRNLAQSQTFGMTAATDPAALLQKPAVKIAVAILFLAWVLR